MTFYEKYGIIYIREKRKGDGSMENSFVLKSLIERFGEHSFCAVGGYVRDKIHGKDLTTDIDIITDATPTQIKEILGRDFYHIEINGVFKIKDGEHTAIEVLSVAKDELLEDLQSRDFTINSILYDFHTDTFTHIPNDFSPNILDSNRFGYFQTNHNATLRAIRISLQYNMIFSERLERQIRQAPMSNLNKQKTLEEIIKIICLPNGVATLQKYDFLHVLIPQFLTTYEYNQNTPWHDLSLFAHINQAVELSEPIPELRMALLFHDLGKPYTSTPNKKDPNKTSYPKHEHKSVELAEKWLSYYEAPNTFKQTVVDIIQLHMAKDIRLEKLREKVGLRTGLLVLQAHLADSLARINMKDTISVLHQRIEDFKLFQPIKIVQDPLKPEMVILIGLPRSGKSSFARLCYPNSTIVSRDIIRERDLSAKGDMSQEGYVTTTFNKELTTAISQRRHIVLDNCNVQSKYRKQFIKQARASGYNVKAVVIDTKYDIILDNAKKEGFPIAVIASMRNRFAFPTLEEGYYTIKCYEMTSRNTFLTKKIDGIYEI